MDDTSVPASAGIGLNPAAELEDARRDEVIRRIVWPGETPESVAAYAAGISAFLRSRLLDASVPGCLATAAVPEGPAPPVIVAGESVQPEALARMAGAWSGAGGEAASRAWRELAQALARGENWLSRLRPTRLGDGTILIELDLDGPG